MSNAEDETSESFVEIENITAAFLIFLDYSIKDSSRDPSYWDKHMISFLSQEYLGSSFLVMKASQLGLYTGAKRELRYLIELALKHCFVEQEAGALSIEDKIKIHEKLLDDHKISFKKELNLIYFDEARRKEFIDEMGRIHSKLSGIVHPTSGQLANGLAKFNVGQTVGKRDVQSDSDIVALANTTYSLVISLLCHALPGNVVGDYLGARYTDGPHWHFLSSRFVAEIDSKFDYKTERKSELAKFMTTRKENIRF